MKAETGARPWHENDRAHSNASKKRALSLSMVLDGIRRIF